MWSLLRDRRLSGFKFYRQFFISGYIVDFCCRNPRLVIELDGGGHARHEQREYDIRRDAIITQHGYHVLRVWNNELTTNAEGVVERIVSLLHSL